MKNPETPGCSSNTRCAGKKCGDECVIGRTKGWCDNKERCRMSHVKCGKQKEVNYFLFDLTTLKTSACSVVSIRISFLS